MAYYYGVQTIDITSYQTFRDAVLGNGYDLDGLFGSQCLDLWMELNYNVGGYTFPYVKAEPNGYAYETWTNQTNREWNTSDKYILITRKEDIKRGDMIILDSNSINEYGHNCLADEDYPNNQDDTIQALGQNQGGEPFPEGGACCNITSVGLDKFLGAFRLKSWQEPIPAQARRFGGKSNFPFVLYARRLRAKRGM